MVECYNELELFRDMLIDEFLRSIETIQDMRKEDEGK